MRGKLLWIAPLFFGYYLDIIEEAERCGYDVTYVCDAPSNSNISKAIGRINKDLIKGATEKYFNEKVLPVLKEQSFDKVLIVGGMTFSFTSEMMKKLKETLANSTFIMYQWDSEKNLPYALSIHPYIDKLFSFDRYDCQGNEKYSFLPLFYTRVYEEIAQSGTDSFEFDCSYVGTAHPQKYKEINEMSEKFKDVFPNQLIYHYMPSKLKFLYHKFKDEEYKKAIYKEFETEKLSKNEMMDIIKKSRCILDAPQAGQTGLTIRTLECLGAKRKLITTNADIKNYDFYNEKNILVFDGNVDMESPFFTHDYEEIPLEIYKKYSLNSWLKTMLGA